MTSSSFFISQFPPHGIPLKYFILLEGVTLLGFLENTSMVCTWVFHLYCALRDAVNNTSLYEGIIQSPNDYIHECWNQGLKKPWLIGPFPEIWSTQNFKISVYMQDPHLHFQGTRIGTGFSPPYITPPHRILIGGTHCSSYPPFS